jgi:glycosyltransferase involved in cell wall biosynthesis
VHLPCGTGPFAGNVPVIVTLHDVIEFLEPYDLSSISSEKLRRFMMKYYTRIIEKQLARKATRIITDSEYSRMDIARLLHVDAAKITAIPIAQGGDFRVINDESRLRQVADKFHLPAEFILAMASSSPRKNVQGLLDGYARLPDEMRRDFPLVIVWTHQLHRETVVQLVDTYQLSGSVMFLPRVSDEELVSLYNLASVFIMPSLYEGFGLPVLEAMACGTPVICSNRTSLPEVAGDAALLVDPAQQESITSALVDLLQSKEKCEHFAQAGLKRAELFSWQHTAWLTYQVYQEVYEQTRGSSR